MPPLPLLGGFNILVSFYLAFSLALRAQNVSGVDRSRIYAALRARLRDAGAHVGAPHGLQLRQFSLELVVGLLREPHHVDRSFRHPDTLAGVRTRGRWLQKPGQRATAQASTTMLVASRIVLTLAATRVSFSVPGGTWMVASPTTSTKRKHVTGSLEHSWHRVLR